MFSFSLTRVRVALIAGMVFALADAEAQTASPAEQAGVSRYLAIQVNHQTAESGKPEWPIFPGHPNSLALRLRDESRTSPLSVTLVKTLPDGMRRQTVATIDAGRVTTLDLGVFTAPVQFEFEAGVVYRRTCEFVLEVRERGRELPIEVLRFQQTIDAANEKEVIALGAPGRAPHFGWRPPNSRPLDPPILLRLAPEVLSDPNDVRVCVQLRPTTNLESSSKQLDAIPGRLRVTSLASNRRIIDRPIQARSRLEQIRLAVADWPEGDYCIEVVPEVAGSNDRDGPAITYRKRAIAANRVLLSPLAPWTFERDATRPAPGGRRDCRRALRGSLPKRSPAEKSS